VNAKHKQRLFEISTTLLFPFQAQYFLCVFQGILSTGWAQTSTAQTTSGTQLSSSRRARTGTDTSIATPCPLQNAIDVWLMWASAACNFIVTLLGVIDIDFDIDVSVSAGVGAMWCYACLPHRKDVIDYLIDCGATVDHANTTGTVRISTYNGIHV
jgi:hypothetical protein